MSGGDDRLDGALPEPEPDTRRGRRSRLGLAVATAALLVAGGFAVSYLGAGRSNTPEEAVEELAAAISDEDLLGVIGALAPSEREVLKSTVEDVSDELRRLKILDEDVDLSGIDGIDIELRDLATTSRSLGDGVSLVDVTGTASLSVEPDALPAGSVLDDTIDPSNAEPVTEEESIEGLELVAIEEDGRWYVSLLYSVADAARRSADLPAPSFGNGVEPEGEGSPEAAVRALVDAAVALDARRAVALVSPDEGRVLHDYAPLFLDDAEAAAAEVRDRFSVEIDAFETSVDRDGDRAAVTVTAFEATAHVDGSETRVDYDGECAEITSDGETFSTCDDEAGAMFGLGLSPLTALAGRLDPSASGGSGREAMQQQLTIATVEHDGQWYVSPLHTVLDPIVETLRQVEPRDIESFRDFFLGFSGAMAAEAGTFDTSSDAADGSGFSAFYSDGETQSTLRNALTAFKVAYIEGEEWPTDPAVLAGIEPEISFIPHRTGRLIVPGVVNFAVDGPTLRLASRGENACFYVEARADGFIGFAEDAACGDLAEQTYGGSWG